MQKCQICKLDLSLIPKKRLNKIPFSLGFCSKSCLKKANNPNKKRIRVLFSTWFKLQLKKQKRVQKSTYCSIPGCNNKGKVSFFLDSNDFLYCSEHFNKTYDLLKRRAFIYWLKETNRYKVYYPTGSGLSRLNENI